VGKPKIQFIELQMRLCREEYAKLKNEVAEIDRKKKRLKRNLLEKSASSSNANGGQTVHSSASLAGLIATNGNDESNSKSEQLSKKL
jgi:hypothetical protein